MNALFGFGLKESSIRSRPCSIGGNDPRASLYKVRANDGNVYIIRQQTSTPEGTWDLVSFRRTDAER